MTLRSHLILASAIKPITALAIMQHVEQGALALDAPVQRYLPTFRVTDPVASQQITVRHLLSLLVDMNGGNISISRDLYIAVPYVTQHAERLAARDGASPLQLYLSAGEMEEDQFPFFHELVAFFEQGNYPGLTLTTEIYTSEGHGSEGVALTYLHGLRMLYPQAES